jgi:hypothetical protein
MLECDAWCPHVFECVEVLSSAYIVVLGSLRAGNKGPNLREVCTLKRGGIRSCLLESEESRRWIAFLFYQGGLAKEPIYLRKKKSNQGNSVQ